MGDRLTWSQIAHMTTDDLFERITPEKAAAHYGLSDLFVERWRGSRIAMKAFMHGVSSGMGRINEPGFRAECIEVLDVRAQEVSDGE